MSRLISLVPALSGCLYELAPKVSMSPLVEQRVPHASAVWVPEGYEVSVVATGLMFPSGITVDEDGTVWVVEAGYAYPDAWVEPKLLRLVDVGTPEVVATGEDAPWTGVDAAFGDLFVAEGGLADGGSILRITPQGAMTPLVTGLPGHGDHHTNGPAVSPDGWVYFAQGTATNSGVVGVDNYLLGWLPKRPGYHDTPCADVTLAGRNFKSANPLEENGGIVTTGAYVPFGTPTEKGQRIEGKVPCNGAVMRVRPDGGPVELVAWGFRNPYGLAFDAGGRLYVTENGPDERGSRHIFGGGDFLWAVTPGAWYGWPDYVGGKPVDTPRFDKIFMKRPKRLLLEDPGTPPDPVAILGVHASADGLEIAPSEFGFGGEAFVAEFGDMAPGVGKVLAPVGRRVVRVDVGTGIIQPFAATRPEAPEGAGLQRPVDVAFAPDGQSLYVLDFGVMAMVGPVPTPQPATGAVWKISRVGAR